MPEPMNITLSDQEVKELYVQLKRQESQLDSRLQMLLLRIEKVLYEKLTIEEIESLQNTSE